MTLINYKSVSKLNWTKYCLLSTVGADINDASSNKIILIIIDTTLYVPVVILSAKNNKKQSKLYSKRFERSVYWNEYKTKSENENTTNECIYFLKSMVVRVNRFFVLAYLSRNNDVKRFKARRCYLPKDIVKNYNIINRKKFYDQVFDSDVKRIWWN